MQLKSMIPMLNFYGVNFAYSGLLKKTLFYPKLSRGFHMNKTTIRAAIISGCLMLGAALPAQAELMKFNLDGVTFTDNTIATGFVTIDTTAHTSSAFDVSTTAGTLSAFNFSNANSGLYFGGGAGPNNFILFTNSGDRYFNFSFASPLNATDASFALNTASSYECMNCSPFRMVTAGSLMNASAVPEPATSALLLPALGIMAWVSRRRKKQAS
jgi:hypothetical protein